VAGDAAKGRGGREVKCPQSFERALAFVLAKEGGYVNDPSDPGGETNYGISKRAYPDLDIKALTLEDAKAIYWTDYWSAAGCGMYLDGFGGFIFDTAVNQGVGFVRGLMEREGFNEAMLIASRLRRYSEIVRKNPDMIKYLRGWVNRVADAIQAFL